MPQVASETPVQSHSLSPARANSARSSQANAGVSPFESLIDDSAPPPPPPAKEQKSSSRTASQEAAQQPAQTPAETRPPKSQQESKADRPAEEDGADRSTAKSGTESGDGAPKTDEAAKPAEQGKPDEAAKLEPLPADGKETDEADKDDTAEGDDAAKPAKANANNAAPDPTAAQTAAQQSTANAQAQAPATTGALVAAAAQAATSQDQAETEADNASPKANAVLTALSDIASTGGPAAKLSAQAEQPAQSAQQAQTPEPEEPAVQTAKAEPAPEPTPESDQKTAEQKSIAAARGEKPADAPRIALPETSGNGAANTQNASAQSATNAAQNINVPNPASHATPQAAANAAAQPAPQAPSAPVPLPGLAVAIAARASAGKNDFSIRLDPPDLGRVDVRLSVDKDGQVTSHLIADRKDTLALLQRDASGLQRALQDAGFKTADNGLQFSLRDSFSQQQQQQSNGGAAGHVVLNDDMPAAEAIPSNYGRYLGRVGGVDIRV